jgi:hypothetical protein
MIETSCDLLMDTIAEASQIQFSTSGISQPVNAPNALSQLMCSCPNKDSRRRVTTSSRGWFEIYRMEGLKHSRKYGLGTTGDANVGTMRRESSLFLTQLLIHILAV